MDARPRTWDLPARRHYTMPVTQARSAVSPKTSPLVISGEPGTYWVNDTSRVVYQFVASLVNTCGACLQYHLQIGPHWGIPLHFGCACHQEAVKRGATSPHAFCDYRELLDSMSHTQQVRAIGASNYRLLTEGLATWDDIVTRTRVRPLIQVVAKLKLTVKQMTDVGVRPDIARRAWATVHTPEADLIEQHRRDLIKALQPGSISQQHLVDELGKRLAKRVIVAPPPGSPPPASPPAAPIAPTPAPLPAPPAAIYPPRPEIVFTTTPLVAPPPAAATTASTGETIPPKPLAERPAPKATELAKVLKETKITVKTAEGKTKVTVNVPPIPKAPPAPPPAAIAPTSGNESAAWKPTMSAAEADRWAGQSVIKHELSHVTTQAAATAIRSEGFRQDLKEKMGRIWGQGTYLGIGSESAEYYKEWTNNPSTLKVRVDVRKVLDFDATEHSPTASQALDVLVERLGMREKFEHLSKAAEDRNDAIMKAFRAVKRSDPKAYRGEAADKWLADHGYAPEKLDRERIIFMDLLRSEGYDAVRVTQKSFTAQVGGDQLIVLDPKRIVVIDE